MNSDQPPESKPTKNSKLRPFTPHIDLSNQQILIRDTNRKENQTANFSFLMKKIVETNNENFLNGETNIIEYLISKSSGLPIEEVQLCKKLSLRIKSDFEVLNQFGLYLTNLVELRITNSNISSINLLGTNFKNLKVLQVKNSNLRDLIGIVCFQNLEVLDVSENQVTDLIDLEMCNSIEKLNLRKNLIEEEENLYFIQTIENLNWLNLNENPVQKNVKYPHILIENLTKLKIIDKDEEIIIQENNDIERKVPKFEKKSIKIDDLSDSRVKDNLMDDNTLDSSTVKLNPIEKKESKLNPVKSVQRIKVDLVTENKGEANKIIQNDSVNVINSQNNEQKIINMKNRLIKESSTSKLAQIKEKKGNNMVKANRQSSCATRKEGQSVNNQGDVENLLYSNLVNNNISTVTIKKKIKEIPTKVLKTNIPLSNDRKI